MHEVGRVVPALPVSLVATAILAGGERGLSSLEIKGAVFELMETLKAEGAHVHIPRQDQEYAVEVGLRMLLMRHLVRAGGRRLPRQSQGRGAAALLCQRHRPSAERRVAGIKGAGSQQHGRRLASRMFGGIARRAQPVPLPLMGRG